MAKKKTTRKRSTNQKSSTSAATTGYPALRVWATLQISHMVYGRCFNLSGQPLIGDEIVVWDDTGSGLIVTVIGRSWDSRTGELSLHCSFAYDIDHDRLKEGGWC